MCSQCGFPLKGNEEICPECGLKLFNEQTFNTTTIEDDTINHRTDNKQTDDWDYSQYKGGVFSYWLFKCPTAKYKDSYDSLNDTLLLGNLACRIIWHTFWPYFLICLVNILMTPIYADLGQACVIITSLLAFIFLIYCLIIRLPKAIGKYWVPLHRTWRRINKRYWLNMYKAVKNNNINSI